MIWQELSIRVPQEYVEPISYLFSRYGHGLSVERVENDSLLLRTYLTNTSKQRMARIEVGVNLIRILQPMGEMEVKNLEEVDWESAWKSHFTLLKIGNRLVIKPSWIDYQAEHDEVVIELDPGMAFGTGYHPTTRMCLEALEGLAQPEMDVLDLGTGSGILAIAAAKLGVASILTLDVDPTAVTAARKNLKASGLAKVVRLARGTLPHNLAPDGRFDLAMANISAKVIRAEAQYLWQSLKPGGMFIASGFIQDQQGEVEETLTNLGFSHLKTYHVEDWIALLLSKSVFHKPRSSPSSPSMGED